MLLKYISAILFLTFPFSHAAQIAPPDFAPVGAVWYYSGFSMSGQHPLITIKSEKDTVIQAKTCRKLAVYSNRELVPVTHYLFHEDNRQVFFYENDSFKILYDFNLGVGDTMYSYQAANRIFVDFTACPGTYEIHVLGKSVVDSISYLILNGDSLKTMHFDFSGLPYYFSEITERIGSMNGLFGRYKDICPTSDEGFVRCYEDDRYFVNFTGEQCDLLSSTQDQEAIKLVIFPNPFSNYFSIKSYYPIAEVCVYEETGRLELRTSENYVHTADLSSGVKFVEILLKDGQRYVEKMLKW